MLNNGVNISEGVPEKHSSKDSSFHAVPLV